MKFSKFSGFEVRPLNSDASIGSVVNAVLSERTNRFSHYLVDTGGLLQRQFSLVAVDYASLAETHVQLNLTEAQLEPILEYQTNNSEPIPPAQMLGAPGPFGQFVSPDFLASMIDALSPTVTNEDAVEMEREELHWLSDLLGLPIFETTQEYGALSDVDFDPFSGALKLLIAQSGDGDIFEIDVSNLRNIAPGQDIIIELKPTPEWAKLST